MSLRLMAVECHFIKSAKVKMNLVTNEDIVLIRENFNQYRVLLDEVIYHIVR